MRIHEDAPPVFALGKDQLVDEITVKNIERELCEYARAGCPSLWIDLGNVDHVTTTGLSRLITLRRLVARYGAELSLTNVGPVLYEVLEATKLSELFPLMEASDAGAARSAAGSSDAAAAVRKTPRRTDRFPVVVICDANASRMESLAATFCDQFRVFKVADPKRLAARCATCRPAAIVLSLGPSESLEPCRQVSDLDAWPLVRDCAERYPLICYAETSKLRRETYYGLMAAGAAMIVNEASSEFVDQLIHGLSRICGRDSGRDDVLARQTFAGLGLVGKSPALMQVFESALTAAEYDDLPVLILGETGTGKQRLAEAIHKLDPQRCQQRFVTINCAAISEMLAESSLFGHRKGAFTGADHDRLGAFRAAQGGTLLLDEIGDLDPVVQPKLLHVLQERQLIPVGEDYEHAVDVRIIAATNRPLEEMVADGKFRADLYERLNTWQIRVPPLRERPEDIQPQAECFLRQSRGTWQSHLEGFSKEVLDAFSHYPWGGNSRQLENLVRSTLARRPAGPLIELHDLPKWVIRSLAGISTRDETPRAGQAHEGPVDFEALAARIWRQETSLGAAMASFERQLIATVLARHDGSRTQTAAALGISERGLFNKLKKYELV